ncbi:hypothetical protein FKW77_003889 [Venturia effusa]|uniref:Uncharacterized protein n=1 Tax=Venturia effusa TaxID=50376 RepID=A0A517LDR7_9PEZI|nr:hypothetical protein FKW77_003889 [Venturia effusa]
MRFNSNFLVALMATLTVAKPVPVENGVASPEVAAVTGAGTTNIVDGAATRSDWIYPS